MIFLKIVLLLYCFMKQLSIQVSMLVTTMCCTSMSVRVVTWGLGLDGLAMLCIVLLVMWQNISLCMVESF